MSIIVLTTAGGAPGTSTSALGLALAWPRPVIVVDADRAGTQTMLAGYLGGADPLGRGLSTFALDTREGRGRADVGAHCLDLGDGKRLLPGFSSPGAATLFEPVWPALMNALTDDGADAIIDAGRIGSGLPKTLVAAADVIAVVTRSSLRSVAAQRVYLPSLREHVQHGHAELGLLVVGPDRPHPTGDVAQVLGLPVWGELPWDLERAEVLSDGCRADRRYPGSPLVKGYARVAGELVSYVDGQRRLVMQEAT